ncbi:MAG: transcriptional regulator [Gemmatimonas sp.]|nr:transcriptional regulator [Gemmatimonas sp.]
MAAHRERSRCPIAYCLDVLGDRWTLLILRDLAFKGRRYFRDFLGASEGISTKILTDRLQRLERGGLAVKAPDPTDRRRAKYFLTDDGLDLLPVLIEMIIWGTHRHLDPELSAERLARVSGDRAGTIRRYREEHIAEREIALQEVS